ncbi:MAG: hypothetical protein MRY63_13390 [Neomegalonema sp.]|nr:hypothetical protein [Neomegalonema sp.]
MAIGNAAAWKLWRMGLMAVLALIITTGLGSAQDQLAGAYYGVDGADGFKVALAPGAEPGSFDVDFIDRSGGLTEFTALGGNGVAEGAAEFEGVQVLMRFSARPVGVVLFLFPIDETGDVVVEKAQSYGFLREGIAVPKGPEVIAAPPEAVVPNYEPLYFLSAYEFWTPVEVGRGYASLLERWRTLIRLYPHVHTDILWKLCQASGEPDGLAEALDGQNITCDQVTERIAATQRRGTFLKYKEEMGLEKARLEDAIKCARDMLAKRQCVLVSKWTAKSATSMETAATILRRYE